MKPNVEFFLLLGTSCKSEAENYITWKNMHEIDGKTTFLSAINDVKWIQVYRNNGHSYHLWALLVLVIVLLY